MDERRDLVWEGCLNVRDLGGLPVGSGGETVWGRVVRADLLGRLTERGKAAAVAYGVRTVVDLRPPSEAAEEPSAVFGAGVRYVGLPEPVRKPAVRALLKQAQNRGEAYGVILDHYPENTLWGMRQIIAAGEGGIVLHCQSGKDRTGLMVALLLRLAGVADGVIAADYGRSQARLWPLEGVEWERQERIAGSSFWARPTATAEMMRMTLAHLDGVYGGVRPYLRYAGLNMDEIVYLEGVLAPTVTSKTR